MLLYLRLRIPEDLTVLNLSLLYHSTVTFCGISPFYIVVFFFFSFFLSFEYKNVGLHCVVFTCVAGKPQQENTGGSAFFVISLCCSGSWRTYRLKSRRWSFCSFPKVWTPCGGKTLQNGCYTTPTKKTMKSTGKTWGRRYLRVRYKHASSTRCRQNRICCGLKVSCHVFFCRVSHSMSSKPSACSPTTWKILPSQWKWSQKPTVLWAWVRFLCRLDQSVVFFQSSRHRFFFFSSPYSPVQASCDDCHRPRTLRERAGHSV